VRGQTLVPSETGSQTYQDVACTWSVQARQGETDLPGRSAVRPTPNCVPLSSGHPFYANVLYNYYIQGKGRDRFLSGQGQPFLEHTRRSIGRDRQHGQQAGVPVAAHHPGYRFLGGAGRETGRVQAKVRLLFPVQLAGQDRRHHLVDAVERLGHQGLGCSLAILCVGENVRERITLGIGKRGRQMSLVSGAK